jgi:2-methylcitrate dehydratase PrpD
MSLPFLNTAPGYDEELRNSVFFERGLHATSICGAVGAAVAVAMLQGQDEAGIASAAGIAASMGAGLLEANRTGGTVKRVHCGWAARCGVAAADLARHGLTGPPNRAGGPLRVPAGVLRRPRPPGRRRPRPGHGLELPRVVFKPYPSNHFTYAGVDAALRLRAQGLAPADVTAIELGVAKPVLRTIAEPPEAKARPASGYHAAFSGPYTVAAALLGGGLGVSHEDFTDAAARDPRRLALAALVRCVEDERCSASFPHAFPAVLRVTTRTGEELEARVEVNRGGPGNPLSDEELARKFHDKRREVPPGGARGRARGPNARPFLTLRASRISPRC